MMRPETVAALYVDARGPYAAMAGMDPWDAARDARAYPGPWPVVAHPPCGPWGRLAHLCTMQDAALGPLAVDQVRRWGGVLEHPAGSRLWEHCGLPAPFDQIPILAPREWALAVEQVRWGHEAEKATWLLFVNVPPSALGPIPPWREPVAVIDSNARHKGTGTGPRHVPKSRRHLTPPAFAAWLVGAARAARASEVAA